MKLASSDGTRAVSLTATGLQYEAPIDDAWLMINCVVLDPRGNWSWLDPSLEVCEAAELADWLRSAAAGKVAPRLPDQQGLTMPSLRFTEPNLSFGIESWNPSRVLIRVHFSYESSPPWAVGRRTSLQNWVPIEMSPAAMLAAADVWDSETAPFRTPPSPSPPSPSPPLPSPRSTWPPS